jgi:gas vesicle protein
MNERGKSMTRRRDLLRAMTTGVAVAAATAVSLAPAAAVAETETETVREKRKARYQANSAEVQDFYRVNRYPAH